MDEEDLELQDQQVQTSAKDSIKKEYMKFLRGTSIPFGQVTISLYYTTHCAVPLYLSNSDYK